MSTTTSSTVTTPVSTSSSAAAASTSPSFVFQPIGEMFTCGQNGIRWTYTGSSSPLTLNITNVNVTQQAPLSTTTAGSTSQASVATSASQAPVGTSALAGIRKRQFNGYGGSYLPPINVVLIAGIDPTANNWTWSSVDVPQGWYQIYANVQNTVQTTSSSFFVQNGTNTNCVPQFAAVPSSSTSAAPGATNTSTLITPSHHSNAGAIAGGVIGGIAFLAAAFVAFLYLYLRRRTSRAQHHDEDGGPRRWSELAFRKSRDTNTRSSIQKPTATVEGDQTMIGSEEEVSTVGHEKAKAIAAIQPAAPQLPPQLPPHQPIFRSQSLRNSTQTTGSVGRGSAIAESPGARSSYNAQPGEAIQLERANTATSSFHHPRRKPAPRYDGAAEAGDGRSSSQSTLDFVAGNSNKGSPDSNHILQRKSSFGAVRPMHVMVTDPPSHAA